jgi:hypothetical protein
MINCRIELEDVWFNTEGGIFRLKNKNKKKMIRKNFSCQNQFHQLTFTKVTIATNAKSAHDDVTSEINPDLDN